MTTPANDNDNQPRPPAFDAAMVAYLPGLRRRAEFMTRDTVKAEELVQETVVAMCATWRQCRMETFKTWAQIVMMRIHCNTARAASAQKRQPRGEFVDATPPVQQHAVELSDVLDRLSRIHNGEIVLRRAMGFELKEIGAENGTSRENIRQKQERALRLLRQRTGRAA